MIAVTETCGGNRKENCTYFESNGNGNRDDMEPYSCKLRICKCGPKICQVTT